MEDLEHKINPAMPSSAVHNANNEENPDSAIAPRPLSLRRVALEGFEGADGVITGLGLIAGSGYLVKYWLTPNIPQITDFCYNLYNSMSSIING